TVSAGLLAASQATAAQAPRTTPREVGRQELSVSSWTKSLTGFFQGFRPKHGPHPPGPDPKPGESSARPEGPAICPSGGMGQGN
ncbi:MAG: hypothetical protein ACLGI9_07470, partial [Thermoanaerobaculia bacterium]